MTSASQKDRALHFRSLHSASPILVLPNAWDAASARIFEHAGFAAIATTSSGVAASLGYPDGQYISRDMLVEATARITRALHCPVSADIESGFGDAIEEVVETVRAIIEAGAVGFNIEDSTKGQEASLVAVSYQVELIRALRQLADSMDVPFVINARTDVFLKSIGDPSSRFEHAVSRANAYREAGADCLFPIGVSDAGLITRLVQGINGPINILASSASPTIPELAQLGVARVSLASGPMRAALGHLRLLARELFDQGTYKYLSEEALSGAEFRELFQ